MDRNAFIKKIIRSSTLTLFAVIGGFLFIKNSTKDEICEENKSLSSCEICRLNLGCEKPEAVIWRSTATINEKIGNIQNEF